MIYPTGDFGVGNTITNTITVTAYEQFTNQELVLTKQLEHGLAIPTFELGNFNKHSRQSNDEYAMNQEVKFYLTNIENAGNVPVNNITLIDTIPLQINLNSVTTGQYNQEGFVKVLYTTNVSNPTNIIDDTTVWQEWISNQPTTASTTLAVGSLGLPANEYITYVKWQINGLEEVPTDLDTIDEVYSKRNKLLPGFKQSSDILITGDILTPDREGNPMTIGDTITNTASIIMSEMVGDKDNPSVNVVKSKNSSAIITVVVPRPWIVPTKGITGGSAYYEKERVHYTLTIKNHDYATGDLVHPIVLDSMPDELEDITFDQFGDSNDWHTVSSSGPTSRMATIDGEVKHLYKLELDKITLKPGESITIKYSGKIVEDTIVGHINNTMYVTTSTDFKGDGKTADSDNIDENVATSYYVKDDAEFFVRFKGSLKSVKWIKGELDTE